MKELLYTIVENLVDNKDAIDIIEKVDNDSDTIILELNVAETDVGKVIGKQGRIAKAIRTVVKSYASSQNKKVIIKID